MKKDKLYIKYEESAKKILDKVQVEPEFMDVLNIVKTCTILNYGFEMCYEEVFERYEHIKPQFVVAVYMLHKGKELNKKIIDSYSILDEPVESWDEYYFNVCKQVARNSKCLSRRIGAILVRDKSIISTGYNGPPRGFPHCNKRYLIDPELRKAMRKISKNPDDVEYHDICPRYVLGAKSGEMLDWCVAGHAERSSLIEAARTGTKTKGATMYMNCSVPCTPCLIEIINAGIKEIVVIDELYYDISAKYIIDNSTLKMRIYNYDKM